MHLFLVFFYLNTESMDFLEKDLEQIIYEATDEQLENLPVRGRRFRQLKIGNYGIADLVFIDRGYTFRIEKFDNEGYPIEEILEYGLIITVCELKKDKIGISALLQAIKYCRGIKTYLEKRGFMNFNFNIVLIGKTIDDSGSFIYMTDMFENYSDECYFERNINKINYFTYSYAFDGIKFKREEGYDLTNNGF